MFKELLFREYFEDFFFDWSDNVRESNRKKKIKECDESYSSNKILKRKSEKNNFTLKNDNNLQDISNFSSNSENLISEESNYKSNSNNSNSMNNNSGNNNSVSNTRIEANNNDKDNKNLNVIKETNEFIKDSQNPEENLRRFLNIVNEPYDYNDNFIRSKKDKEKDEIKKQKSQNTIKKDEEKEELKKE